MSERRVKPYANTTSGILLPFARNPMFALAAHWVFQGMLKMHPTERLFKIGTDLILMAVFLPILHFAFGIRSPWSVVIAFTGAHSLNFLFNGMIWSAIKNFGFMRRSRADYDVYVGRLADRISAEPSVSYAVALGSVARDDWQPTSDWDVRLIRYPGFWNGMRGCVFVLGERTRATWSRFPLDIILWDHARGLSRLVSKEPPVVVCDRRDIGDRPIRAG